MLPKKTFKDLIISQKLKKSDILPLFNILGYPLPTITRKDELVDTLDKNIKTHFNENKNQSLGNNIISLDLGLKNMSLSNFKFFHNKNNNKKSNIENYPILNQWLKINLDLTNIQFNPINYSIITLNFLNEYIFKNNSNLPLNIIMERQRFRTGGSSSVLESTLKTNTIESMICMGLTIQNDFNNKTNKTNNNIKFWATYPGSMVKYWQLLYYNNKKLNENESKLFRIELVLNMLYASLKSNKLLPSNINKNAKLNKYTTDFSHDKIYFKLSDNITTGLSKYLKNSNNMESWNKAWSFISTSRRLWEITRIINQINSKEFQVNDDFWHVKKGDDLADSLLHGITYNEYLKNRVKLQKIIEKNDNITNILNELKV